LIHRHAPGTHRRVPWNARHATGNPGAVTPSPRHARGNPRLVHGGDCQVHGSPRHVRGDPRQPANYSVAPFFCHPERSQRASYVLSRGDIALRKPI
jgi:hypothetical protein